MSSAEKQGVFHVPQPFMRGLPAHFQLR